MKVLVAIVCVITGACYQPGYRDCEVQCSSPALTCPSGLKCHTQSMQCRVEGAGPTCIDAPAADDAPIECIPTVQLVASQIAASNYNTCARRADGSVLCWGMNLHGETGRLPAQRTCLGPPGMDGCNPTPARIELPMPATLAGLGNEHSCAVLADTSMFCWGSNTQQRFGGGAVGDAREPENVLRSGATVIAAGDAHMCTLGIPGFPMDEVRCSGENADSQVGNGGTNAASSPEEPMLLPPVSSIDSGVKHMCAVGMDGILCWGLNDRAQSDPRVLVTPPARTTAPRLVDATSDAVTVALGLSHTCYLTDGKGVRCWGANHDGQLGRGTQGQALENFAPGAVPALQADVSAISAGYDETCAIKINGTLWCWGSGSGFSTTPVERKLPLNRTAEQIALGSEHMCALLDDGTVMCWGEDNRGQHGDGPTEATMPTLVLVCPTPL